MLGWLVGLRLAYSSYTGYVSTAFIIDSMPDRLPFSFYQRMKYDRISKCFAHYSDTSGCSERSFYSLLVGITAC